VPVATVRISNVPNPTPAFPDGLFIAGSRIAVQLEVASVLAKQLAAEGKPIPQPVTGTALIDTGATRSAIDDRTVSKLGLSPVGLVKLGTAAGQKLQALYPLKLTLPQLARVIEFESVTGCDLSGTGFEMLIGRDVLRLGLFVYDGVSGSFSLAL